MTKTSVMPAQAGNHIRIAVIHPGWLLKPTFSAGLSLFFHRVIRYNMINDYMIFIVCQRVIFSCIPCKTVNGCPPARA